MTSRTGQTGIRRAKAETGLGQKAEITTGRRRSRRIRDSQGRVEEARQENAGKSHTTKNNLVN